MPDRDSTRAGRPPAATRRLDPWRRAEAPILVSGCIRDEPGAWGEFLRRYGNLIYSTLHRLGLDDEAKEEGFQSAVIGIHRALPDLRDTGRLIAWIIRISYRSGVNQIRLRTRIKETAIDDLTDAALRRDAMPIGEEPAPPDELRIRLERAQLAGELLEAMSERCRRLLALLFFENPAPDYTEISRRERIPMGSIGPTRARCLEKARQIAAERHLLD